MANYSTIDYLPDLTADEMNRAIILTFSNIDSAPDNVGWDNSATFYTTEDYAILKDTFVFEGKEGATYDLFSGSFLDPYILLLYDDKGNVIATDTGQGKEGTDIIFGYVAPYTGNYYMSASWQQGTGTEDKLVSVRVYEDVDTIETVPPPSPPPVITTDSRDRVFNWGESAYSQLFPEHRNSHDLLGYYARIYSNGDALGEKDDYIYYYDGGADGTKEIVMVGTLTDFLPQAEAAGF